MYSYAYIIMTTVFIVIWIILFILLHRSRPAILWTSLMLGMAGPVGEYWLISSYWRPIYLVHVTYRSWTFGLEDFLITFAIAGISAGVFENIALKYGFAELPRLTGKILLRIFTFCVVGFFLMVLLSSVFRVTPIHALFLAVIIPTVLALYGRWKTLRLIIPIAVIFGFLFWLFYILFMFPLFPGLIQTLWNLDATFGIMLLGVPLEEMLWAFITALFAGPIYRVCCFNFLGNILGIKKTGISSSF